MDVDRDETSCTLQVAEGVNKDVGRGIARLDPADITDLGLEIGDVVRLDGDRTTVAKILPAYPDERGRSAIQLGGILRGNAEVGIGDSVRVSPTDATPAQRLVIVPTTRLSEQDVDHLGELVDGIPVVEGDTLQVSLMGSSRPTFRVDRTRPSGAVLINSRTTLELADRDSSEPPPQDSRTSYEDIGGLGTELERVREMIEAPIRSPEIFDQLGIEPPKGVLLKGPPGCGKTLLARTIASEVSATFFSISGPEVIQKLYGESEAQLREIFEEASEQAPTIVFIDEIDAIAPKREEVVGDVEKRVVATLLALMDGLEGRGEVIVIAATNRADAVDPALRRGGRFDREIAVPIPDREGRLEILEIHTRGMPLAEDVDAGELADRTHGFVGADLAALSREAAMTALRRAFPDFGLSGGTISYRELESIEVRMGDFNDALYEIDPSATREVFVDVPDVGWGEVGGLDEVIDQFVESVEWPLEHPELFEAADVEPARGILLAGPPGCGKTLLAKAVANETDVNFIPVQGPELLSKYVGESERGVREIFRKARDAAPCIIFFDEIDALAPDRRAEAFDSNVSSRVVTQFLVEFDGVQDLDDVVVIGATNRRDLLDPALLRPGRFDEVIEISLPDARARREIFEVHLSDKPVRDVEIDELVERTAGHSGADIAAVCRRAALDSIRETLRTVEPQNVEPAAVAIEQSHLSRVVDTLGVDR